MKNRQRIIRQIKAKKFVDDYIYRIDLDADYQREKIWSRKNQEELVDSILQNIDIPKLYLAKVVDDTFDFECIDGKQRMSALLSFFKPDTDDESPLTVRVAGDKYTYEELKIEHPNLAARMDDFTLTVVIYPEVDEELIREIFRRLQLGIRLNSGEMLNSMIGAMRDFIFKEMGNNTPFIRRTSLSEKRFSRQFALAQITLNSIKRNGDDFVRARFTDLEDFFRDNTTIEHDDAHFVRIRSVLKIMDTEFKLVAPHISSRAIAVTAYFFVEDLRAANKEDLVPLFAKFYGELLSAVNNELARLAAYKKPNHPRLLEDFQKYISQASVEPYAIKRRHLFLKTAFEYYRKKGKLIG